jgi:hypothetical protein
MTVPCVSNRASFTGLRRAPRSRSILLNQDPSSGLTKLRASPGLPILAVLPMRWMYESGESGKVEINHVRDIRNIQSARRDVGCDQHGVTPNGPCWLVTLRQAARGRAGSPRHSQQKWEGTYGPPEALFAVTWGWSSGTRSKASGRAAVELDQIRTRFLCRSRHSHTTSGVSQTPSQYYVIWFCKEQEDLVRETCAEKTRSITQADRRVQSLSVVRERGGRKGRGDDPRFGVVRKPIAFRRHAHQIGIELAVGILVMNDGQRIRSRRDCFQSRNAPPCFGFLPQ